MANLSVNYMGMKLSSPFIAASSGFTSNVDDIIKLEKAGAGAVVLKSLFEEQIENEAKFLDSESQSHPENADFLYNFLKANSINKYLELISNAKAAVKIPIIPSISCYSKGNWLMFAKEIEKAGADAIEINIYAMPVEKGLSAKQIIEDQLKIVADIAKSVSIPIAVKISDNYTNLCEFVDSLSICKAKAVVMFNRFFRPDIDLHKMSIVSAYPFSSKEDYLREMRWIAIASSQQHKIDFSATSGVLDPDDGIKLILSGASTVQLCSVIYQQGIEIVEKFNTTLELFMKAKGFENLQEMIGKMNYSNIQHPDKYERVQFMKLRENV